MPVHVENHHIGRDVVALQVRHDLTVVVGRVRRILAVPVAKHIVGRERDASCYLRIIGQRLLVVVAIAQEIGVHGMIVGTFCPPVVAHSGVGSKGVRASAVGAGRGP